MRRVLIILLLIAGLSTFVFADKGFIQFSGGLGTYAYFSPEELKAFENNHNLNYLNKMRVGGLIDLNLNFSNSFSLGAETGIFMNCDMVNIAKGSLDFDIPLYAIMRIQPGLLFLQPEVGVIFNMTKVVKDTPLYEMAVAYGQPVPEDKPFSLDRFSIDVGTKIGVSLGGLAIYGDLGLIYDTFDNIGKPGLQYRLGAGILFGV